MSRFYGFIAKKYGSDAYREQSHLFENKYEHLKENVDAMGDFLDDYIDKELYFKHIDTLVDEIHKKVDVMKYKTMGCGFGDNMLIHVELEKYLGKEAMKKELKKYRMFGTYNRYYDVFHGSFSQMKWCVERFDMLNFGKGKLSRNTKGRLEDMFRYYKEVIYKRKIMKFKFKKKKEWKKVRKQKFVFMYDAKGTNFTHDRYDNKSKKGIVIIDAKHRKHAEEMLVGENKDGGLIKRLLNSHRLDTCSLRRISNSKVATNLHKKTNPKRNYRCYNSNIILCDNEKIIQSI